MATTISDAVTTVRSRDTLPTRRPNPKLSTIVPDQVLGCAAFSGEINFNPNDLPVKDIIQRSLQLDIRAFDTSPYYGDSEILLGDALASIAQEGTYKRADYLLMTKVGRISPQSFNYSRDWVRASVERSLKRFHTNYLDVVFCHDVEFVTTDEVLEAVSCLYELAEAGIVRYVGISGYPAERLWRLSRLVKERLGRPLDAIQSYANFTLQNTTIQEYLPKIHRTGVDVVFTSSPLAMGLLRKNGVPVAELGDFHPAPNGLRAASKEASDWLEAREEDLATLAIRFACSKWKIANERLGSCGSVIFGGCSSIWELEENIKAINQIMEVNKQTRKAVVRSKQLADDEKLFAEVQRILGKWVGYSWESPGTKWTRKTAQASAKI